MKLITSSDHKKLQNYKARAFAGVADNWYLSKYLQISVLSHFSYLFFN